MTTIGILHPGEMGASIAARLVEAGTRVVWASEGRSSATADRAADAGLEDVGTAADVARASDVVVSVCPPHAALDVARSLGQFDGIVLDANAIAPFTSREIGSVVATRGARYVDGGIIGPPPGAGATRLYLSGADADEIAALFSEADGITARVISGEPGAASALKMCFSAWTKGNEALLLAIRALARIEAVEDPLLGEWAPMGLDERSRHAARAASQKGWRWVGEMEQIAATFAARDLPDGFHGAAAEVFRRITRDDNASADDAHLARVLDDLV